MGSIVDYLKEYGSYTLEEKPFNMVDNLILSQLAYLKFDGMVSGMEEDREAVIFKQLEYHKDRNQLFADSRFAEENTALYQALLESRRFRNLFLNYYENIVDVEKETQFSAITLGLEDGTVYLAYRGTDETLVGWKEDFNLAFSHPVEGQKKSVEYLNQVGKKTKGRLYVGGHSKGGNFAVYAAINCDRQLQKRILRVFSNDGPGFRPEIREKWEEERMKGRITKIVPHSSLVGMLLEYQTVDYMVVESRAIGLLQHDPFTWLVEEDHFVQVKEVYKGRRFLDDTLNQWILSLNEEQLHLFVDTLYEVVAAAEAETLIEFTANWKKSMAAVAVAFKELDEETVAMLKKLLSSLFVLVAERFREGLREFPKLKETT